MGSWRYGTAKSLRRGVTLVELMVTLSVLAILLAVGVPSFGRLLASNRMAGQTNELVGGLNLARAEAIRRGQGVALRASTATDPVDFAPGWAIFTDDDADGAIPGTVTPTDGTVILQLNGSGGKTTMKRVTRSGTAGSYSYADASTSMADRAYVVFNSRGANNAGSPTFFKICDSGDSSIKGRIVQVSAVGRISLDTTTLAC